MILHEILTLNVLVQDLLEGTLGLSANYVHLGFHPKVGRATSGTALSFSEAYDRSKGVVNIHNQSKLAINSILNLTRLDSYKN